MMRFTNYLLAFALTALTSVPISNAREVVQRDRRPAEGSRHVIDGMVEYNDAAVASDGVNFLLISTEGIDRVLHATLIGPRGNVIVDHHRLSTGIAHARPAVVWNGERYLVASIDMQIPRRLVVHQVDAEARLIPSPPVEIAREEFSSVFPADSVVRAVQNVDGAQVLWRSVDLPFPGAGRGIGAGMALLAPDGTPRSITKAALPPFDSVASDGDSRVVFAEPGANCHGSAIPECVGEASFGLLRKIDSSGVGLLTAHWILPGSLASSPVGYALVDTAERQPRIRRGDSEAASDTILWGEAHRSAWTGDAFVITWVPWLGTDDRFLRVAFMTPRVDGSPVVSPFIDLGKLEDPETKLMAIAGNNRGAALILLHNPDLTIEWRIVARSRSRVVRR